MKPHRLRLTHNLVVHYGLANLMEARRAAPPLRCGPSCRAGRVPGADRYPQQHPAVRRAGIQAAAGHGARGAGVPRGGLRALPGHRHAGQQGAARRGPAPRTDAGLGAAEDPGARTGRARAAPATRQAAARAGGAPGGAAQVLRRRGLPRLYGPVALLPGATAPPVAPRRARAPAARACACAALRPRRRAADRPARRRAAAVRGRLGRRRGKAELPQRGRRHELDGRPAPRQKGRGAPPPRCTPLAAMQPCMHAHGSPEHVS